MSKEMCLLAMFSGMVLLAINVKYGALSPGLADADLV